jgi:exo-beta-1,3-glucanase (GH17 family)
LRNGESYYIKGAGGTEYLGILKSIGGNSIRTWSTANAKKVLDDAYANGISVCLGLWVGHERHGFNYNDEYAVTSQLKAFEKEIIKYKDHPALLMWAVGNEVDLFYKNFRVWNAVEEIAKMIKNIDPDHPTMTVTAGIDPAEVFMIKTYCPSIDILGVNTYGGIQHISDAVRMYGWEKPYMITEWGPYGHWESPMTTWGVAVEATSNEKANFREIAYKSISKDVDLCLGSYAFLWGYKQEQTPTWYGLFTKDGNATQSIDVLNSCWGNNDRNRAPILHSFLLNNQDKKESVKLKRGKDCIFTYKVADPDNDSLVYIFQLMPESTDKKSGGDFEKTPEPITFKVVEKSNNKIVIKAPSRPGPYRFFIYIRDNNKNIATANIPFYVN